MTDPQMKFHRSPASKDREIQPFSSFQALNVQPDAPTNLKLSGGQTIPYIYSLGVNSTIPYIRLLGGANSQKLFSWNEQIVVPPRTFVTVANASYHPGDIFIQAGSDPSAKPGRVTIPFTLREVVVPSADNYVEPTFVVDTRRARRAYVVGFSSTLNDLPMYTFNAVGYAHARSHIVNPTYSSEADPVALFVSTIEVAPFTDPGILPLGNKALFTDTVHDLLDFASFTWTDIATESLSGGFHYVLEYL